jgi:5-formyltetrahydrofolate cyclo-ligase
MKTKSEIRKEIINKLEKQSPDERRRKSLLIKNRLFSLDEFKKANLVMFYVSTEFEVDTKDMIDDALKMGKQVAAPYVLMKEKKMLPLLIKNRVTDLKKGCYGISEPDPSLHPQVRPEAIDLVIVPGLAFTEDGMRLGRGRGYYDRFLKGLKHTATVGLAFGLQVILSLPHNSYDIPVKRVITDVSN